MKNLLKLVESRGSYVFIATIVTVLICVGHEGVFYFILLSILISAAPCFLASNLDKDAAIHFRKHKPEFRIVLRIGKWYILYVFVLLLTIPLSREALGSTIRQTGISTNMMFVPTLAIVLASAVSFIRKVVRMKIKLSRLRKGTMHHA